MSDIKELKKVLDEIIDLVFPPRCPVCDRPLLISDKDRGICRKCIEILPVIKGDRCIKCGRALDDKNEENMCAECKKNPVRNFDRGMALCEYDDTVRHMIYRFKYGKRREYGDVLGRLMGKRFAASIKRAGIQGVIPVPLHEKRYDQRGYNQAELLAESIGRETDIPCYPHYVKRCRNTLPMKTLSGEKRQNNLKKAFIIGQNDVKLDKVLLVDDIYTTGSTLDAVAKELKRNGVKKVYFLTLSIGSGR